MKIEIYDGSSIAENLTVLGLPCEFINYTISPNCVLYDFKYKNINDYKKLKNKIELLKLSSGLNNIEIVTARPSVHFTLKIERDKKELVTFANTNRMLNDKPDGEFLLGVDDENIINTININDCPHLLVAGEPGSGKSVFLNSLISSICCYSKNVDLILIDVKQVEFSQFANSSHLITPVISDYITALNTLKWACDEIDRRYTHLKNLGLRNNDTNVFNKIIIVIDELANLMLKSSGKVENYIVRIAQIGRACSVHLVIAMQCPTINVCTGLIKNANIPARVCFKVASSRDSLVVLGKSGAEKLNGKGDCIVKIPSKQDFIRLQTPYISAEDIQYIFSNCSPRVWENSNEQTQAKKNKNNEISRELGKSKFFKFIFKLFTGKPYNVQEMIDYNNSDD